MLTCMKVYRNPNQHAVDNNDYDRLFYRCDACDTYLKIDRTPEGGEYVPTTRATPTAGQTWGDPVYAAQGCWFCGTPAWRHGAKLGDLKRTP